MTDAASFWENRYRESGPSWSGRPNAALVREVSGLAPGTALDVGSGEGGDALWLAANGWSVTAVDISPTALAIGAARATAEQDIQWIAADLASWRPVARYDLVTSHFLHSLVELPRELILARAASAVTPGGVLLVVGHADAPHGAHQAPDGMVFPGPEQVLAALELASAEWEVLTCALVEREAAGHDGSPSTLVDSVLALRRAAA